MVFLMYMYKLVSINIDSNHEEIRDQEKNIFGVYLLATIEITQQSLAIVRNNQYWVYLGNKSNMIKKFFDAEFACYVTL